MSRIALRAVSKEYPGQVPALRDIDLEVAEGAFLTIVGPSGSGKSTLLRLIAGLETPTAGRVVLDGRPADDLPPWRRGVAMVFQEQPPYPHLDVHGNLAFALRATGLPRAEVRDRVREVAALLGLDGLLDRRPATLSGGQRRRVVLGRAVARRPRVLLLDEPLSGLDAPLRAAMRALLATLHRQFSMTLVLVTHDQADALALGDHVAVLVDGQLAQHGPPGEVYDRPATLDVAQFIGEPPMNLLTACWLDDPSGSRLRLLGRDLPLPGPNFGTSPGPSGADRPVVLGLRPEHLEITSRPSRGAVAALPGTVHRVERLGPDSVVEADLGGGQALRVRTRGQVDVRVGDPIGVRLDLEAASWFDPATGRRIGPPRPLESGE